MCIVKWIENGERKRTLKKLYAIVEKINSHEEEYLKLTDEQLKAKTEEYKERIKNGETLNDLLPEAFATVKEAATRVLKLRHYDVQLVGGIVLHQGRIAEMKTGEGKTLVATLPAYLNALSGQQVHIVTVNDYLAKRDAEWMGKIYKFLGMKVGCIYPGMSREQKQQAYDSDILYCTNNELGFDYLRDNMVTNKDNVFQKVHSFAIVDEVDSILIDEARTPLIISAPAEKSGDIYVRCQKFINILKETDYTIDEKEAHIYLSEDGLEKAERYFNCDLSDVANSDLNTKINNALRANFLMANNQDYIVENNEVVIVDEFTGRKMAGRRYSDGLHQAIEAKEGVQVRKENKTVATITFQNLFRLYDKLSGMTGTAKTEEEEFNGIYNLDVVEIPTNKEVNRVDEPDKVFSTKEAKLEAVVEDIIETYNRKQPVLVGTINVEASEDLSKRLFKKRIPHNVLNAKSNDKEAQIIAQAGRLGTVTIATNMAGRGTDILLGGNPEYMAKEEMIKEGYSPELISIASAFNTLTDQDEIKAREHYYALVKKHKEETDKEKEEVKKLGGLKVIGTERHESRRIDNQLRGRAGRQGDEGRSVFYVSFEDDLMKRFGGDRISGIMSTLIKDDTVSLQVSALSKQIANAQKRCEDANYQTRKYVLQYDDVMNQQRKIIYSQRNDVLNGKDVHDQVIKYIEPVAESILFTYVNFSTGDETTVDYASFNATLEHKLLKKGTNLIDQEIVKHRDYDLILQTIVKEAQKQYQEKFDLAKENGIMFEDVERQVLLRSVDQLWMDHIDNMDILRKGIGLRGIGQRDPVIEYRREGTDMFNDMIEKIQNNVCVMLCKVYDVNQMIEIKNNILRQQEAIRQRREGVNANAPCPCGSGIKYKDCCGKKKR
ncbi:MAG: preprotein translocase subunit SecA [Clostridia bacterium]|nr:preprotein translocase subunit SecA [Clostridia bacterium]